jgi:U3 small nucleolar RNA-associated protein 14
LDILDGRGEADNEDEVHGMSAKETRHPENSDENPNQDDEDSENSEESEDSEMDDGEPELSMSSVSDTEDAPGDLENLEKFITNLDPTTKRKSTGDPDPDERAEIRPKKRRLVEERTEAGVENEFHAQLNGTPFVSLVNAGMKLTCDTFERYKA